MKKLIPYLFFLASFFCTKAFHIVGGEIEFVYLGDGLYRINLIQYFDQAQDENPGPDLFANVYIFRNGDNALMSQHTLALIDTEAVLYTNIECAIEELQTTRVLYSIDVELEPSFYASEEGYYIQWERCCRNATIDNILNPDGTGMNYVLEIPPLMKDGEVFVNSSPILFKPLSDYACINQLYYVEFTGTDPDGDSLAYSLATPLNSSSQVALPIPQPKPHFSVAFGPGYSQNEMIPGSPPLKISGKGLLTVNPTETGIFVFAIKVEEFRDGEKIGEVRRDFQMLVVDGCEPPDPPEVDIDIPDDPDFNPETDILEYTVSDAKCFNFLVSNVTAGETILLRAEGVNFDEDLDEIFQINRVPVDGTSSELEIEVCIPDCPPIRDEPFILDLIASDDACPLPQLDTMRLTINVQPPPNETPVPSFSTLTVVQQEDNNPIYTQTITATDSDGEEMELSLYIDGFEDPTTFGFDLEVVSTSAGAIEGQLIWDTDCTLYDFSEFNQFDLKVIVNDNDDCLAPGDTIAIDALVVLPPNTDPFISLAGSLPSQVDLGSTLNFDLTATDSDNDIVSLRFIGGNFDPQFYPISFQDIEGNGSVTSTFNWNIACSELYSDGQEFELLFIADDEDKCKVKNFDTLRHVLTINYPVNSDPLFDDIERFQSLRVNEPVQIPINAFDTDGDLITVQLAQGFRQPASNSIFMEPASGNGSASGILEWQPECSLLRFGETSSLLDVVFEVTDDGCPVPKTDTLKVTFEIFDDSERQQSFLPPNVFTPNGDGMNDQFKLFGNIEINQNLPPDNCDNTFEYIVINNRAGVEVYRSENRDFIWNGGQFPSGIYYYLVQYSNSEFKGYVQLIR